MATWRRPFGLTSAVMGRTLTLVVEGELDASGSGRLVEAADEARTAGATDVVVDCRALTFVDSRGVGELLELKLRVEEAGGMLVLFAPTGVVRSTLEVTRLDDVFRIVDA